MTKEVDLKKIASELAKSGVSASMVKSRLDVLKVLAPPLQETNIQSQL